MPHRYNAPPNWPQPPEGWNPPEGWKPDPEWGPSPRGWQFWIEVPESLEDKPGPSPAAAQPTESKDAPSTSWFARHKVLTVVGSAVVLLASIAAIRSIGSQPTTLTTTVEPAATSSVAPTSASSSPAPSRPPTPTKKAESPKASPTPKPTKPPPTAAPKPVVLNFSGRGDEVVQLKKPISDIKLITTTRTGSEANHTMSALDSDGNEGELLVDTMGSYSGSTLLNRSDAETAALKIEGNGRWKIRIEPISKAHRWDGKGTFEGKGDDVVSVRGVFAGGDTLSFTSTEAEGRTTLHGIRNEGAKRIINAVGVFSWKYSVPAGVSLFHVRSDGEWTLKKS